MVDEPRRQRVEVEVAHAVGAHDHRRLLPVELVDDALQGVGRGIEIVAVELHGEAAAAHIVHGHVPTSADSQVGALRNEVADERVPGGYLLDDERRAVGGVVVDDDDIEPEVGLLPTGRVHGVGNRPLTVIHGDDDRCLVFEVLLAEVGLCIERRVYERTHLTEMLGAGPLHLFLRLTVARVHIVELPLAAPAGVGLLHGVEKLVQVEELAATREEEAQVIEPRKAIVGMRQGGIFAEQRGADEQQLAEVEVVSQRSFLVVDDGMAVPLAALHGVVVGIHHGGIPVHGHPQHAFQGIVAQREGRGLLAQEHILGLGTGRHPEHRGRRPWRVYLHHPAVGGNTVGLGKPCRHQ